MINKYVLIACEESQRVCTEFRKLGFESFSCDILPESGGHPEWHIQQDVIPLLNGCCSFETRDGASHILNRKWDMIIAHPPCTYLTPAGAANIPKHPERIELGWKAKEFFMEIYNTDCPYIAIENPPPMKRFNLPHYTQLVRPWMFGENNNKPIALWLKGLPNLKPTDLINPEPEMVVWTYKKNGVRKSCSKWYNTNTNKHSEHRSKTFINFAKAMAAQWSEVLKGEKHGKDNS